jgi:predicted translin family RNA/ssDNA-binding protein
MSVDTHELVMQEGWILVIYGIPCELDWYRERLREICRTYGLTKIDRGGSVYLGPENPDFDARMSEALRELESVAGGQRLVYFVRGRYSKEQALALKDAMVRSVLEEIDLIEKSMDQVEKALAGEIEIKDRDGEVLEDLTAWSRRRIYSAKNILDDCERVAIRLDAKYGEDATKIRQKVSQVRAWVEKIEKGVTKYAAAKKAEVKTDE